MSAFLELGFRHILGPGALDHLLFLLVLVAPYRVRDWRHLLGVASAFTVGHSITLALVSTDAVRVPSPLVEFLIPVTIVCAGLANLVHADRRPHGWKSPTVAGCFGLIHGAGFANVLRELLGGSVVMPLLGFNLGIELGQLVVLAATLPLLSACDRVLQAMRPAAGMAPRSRLLSGVAAGWATFIALQRVPW